MSGGVTAPLLRSLRRQHHLGLMTVGQEWSDIMRTLHHHHPPEAHTQGMGLSVADRCDRCGARAMVRLEHAATGWEAVLLLCAHHHREHGVALRADGWVVKS